MDGSETNLSIRCGRWFEASARGFAAIVALVVIVAMAIYAANVG